MGNEKILTLQTIYDYIQIYYPDLKFWNNTKDSHEPRSPYKNNYKHRAGMPNEIRIEFDGDDREKNWVNINQTAINLWNAGYNFAIYYVEGGRSPHLHLYDHDELDNYDVEFRNRYREKFLRKFCPNGSNPDIGLCDEKHLCALEFVPHFKYGKPKELLNFFYQGALNNQGCDFEIIWEMLHPNKKRTSKKDEKIALANQKNFTITEAIKQGRRNFIIDKLNFQTVFEKYGIKNKGKMALCPFHADTNYSLSFSNEKGLWKCWGTGCEKKGDIITLIKELENARKKREADNKK